MTWPTDDISLTNLDASTDSAATARADLYNLAQRVKDIIAGRNTASGICPLGSDSKVPSANLPAMSYLPLTGGTVSGATTFSSTLGVSGTLTTAAINASGNITATAGNITTSANYINANKNSQTGYNTAGLQSTSTTGNAGIGLHCVGVSAAYIEHVRGGSGVVVKDAGGAYANFLSANLTCTGAIYAGNTYTGYCYISADASNSIYSFDSTDYIAYNRAVNNLQLVIANTIWLVMSSEGIHPYSNNTVNCGKSGFNFASLYATNLFYTNLYPQSDRNLKDHIRYVDRNESGSIIDALGDLAVWFDWKADGQRDVNFYAQDVHPIVPEIAFPPKEGVCEHWTFRPERLIPFLTNQAKALRERAEETERKLEATKDALTKALEVVALLTDRVAALEARP
jgi:hypothetical protein